MTDDRDSAASLNFCLLGTDTEETVLSAAGRGCGASVKIFCRKPCHTLEQTQMRAKSQLWKLAKSSHGQLVTLHIGSQCVGWADACCVPTSTPSVCVHTWTPVCVCEKRDSARPPRRGPIEPIQFPIPLCLGLTTVWRQGRRDDLYQRGSCLCKHTHTDTMSDTASRLKVH